MRLCPACGYENDDSVDFCRCGEFIAWDRTTEEAGGERGDATTAPVATVARLATEHVTLQLLGAGRLDDDGRELTVRVPAGGRVTFAARVRNQSDIVDSYRVTVEGLPDGWWTVDPPTTYLLPSPRDGHEEDVVIAVEPPRTPAASAGRWPLTVVATSLSHPTRVARAFAAIDVEPFWQIGAEPRPVRATSRRRVVIQAAVTNVGNAAVPVRIDGADADDRCRVEPPLEPARIPAGRAWSIPVRVCPKRPHLIGRPVVHRLALAARTADDQELEARFAAEYRQRAWIPWWVVPIVLLLAIAGLLVWYLWPEHATVPNVKKARSAFAAQKRLEKEGLTLNPKVRRVPRPKLRPGTVVDQAPAPGEEVDKGKAVSVIVAAGRGRVTVPRLRGLRVTSADQRLQKRGLTLGAVLPEIDPKARIAGQVPRPGVLRRRGSPVNVTLAKPKKSDKDGDEDGKTKKAENGAAGEGAAAGGAAGGEGAAAAAAAAARLRIAFNTGTGVFVAGPADPPLVPIEAPGASVTSTGAWSPDGARIAYVASGSVFVVPPVAGAVPERVGVGMRPGGERRSAAHVAFAPYPGHALLAFVDRGGAPGGDAICWVDVTRRTGRAVSCRALPRRRVDGIAWSPTGRRMILSAEAGGRFGLLRLRSSAAFASTARAWRGGDRLVLPSSAAGRGVRSVAYSPTGERLAIVTNIARPVRDFRVATAATVELERPKRWKYLPVQGCDVAWRPDEGELAVVQSGGGCVAPRIGPIVRVSLADPRTLETVAVLGEHPSWEPLKPRPAR